MLLPVSRAGSNVKAPFSFLRKFHCLPSTFPPLLVAMPTLEIHPFLTIKIFRNPPSNQVCILFFKLEVRYCGLKFSMCLPPNSSVMVHSKTSHLKVLKFLREKNQTGQFFLGFPIVGLKKSCHKLTLWVSKPIRKNTKPMKKESAQSDIKPKTTRK